MKHFFIDKFGYLDSPLHRMNTVAKIVAAIAFLVYLILSPPALWNYLACLAILLLTMLISRVPPAFIFARTFEVLPFLLLITVFIPIFREDGLRIFLETFARGLLSVLTLVMLVSTTKFPRLLKGLSAMGAPRAIIVILSFMYRYFFVLVDEMERMKLAIKARAGKSSRLKIVIVFANAIGMLFIRSYERSERLYGAMLMRGFTGEAKDL